jgi:hypothetical protein
VGDQEARLYPADDVVLERLGLHRYREAVKAIVDVLTRA